jgi:hypothetical protein
VNVPSLERTLGRVAWGFIYLIANNSEMHDASINLDIIRILACRGGLRTPTSSTASRAGRSVLKERRATSQESEKDVKQDKGHRGDATDLCPCSQVG